MITHRIQTGVTASGLHYRSVCARGPHRMSEVGTPRDGLCRSTVWRNGHSPGIMQSPPITFHNPGNVSRNNHTSNIISFSSPPPPPFAPRCSQEICSFRSSKQRMLLTVADVTTTRCRVDCTFRSTILTTDFWIRLLTNTFMKSYFPLCTHAAIKLCHNWLPKPDVHPGCGGCHATKVDSVDLI
jgi:hypothetical protein